LINVDFLQMLYIIQSIQSFLIFFLENTHKYNENNHQ
jgi:hypothetical protein